MTEMRSKYLCVRCGARCPESVPHACVEWPPLGRYRHYKGGLYNVVAHAVHHDTREPMVVYQSVLDGHVNVRPLHGTPADPDGWLDPVDGRKRFTSAADGATPSARSCGRKSSVLRR